MSSSGRKCARTTIVGRAESGNGRRLSGISYRFLFEETFSSDSIKVVWFNYTSALRVAFSHDFVHNTFANSLGAAELS